LGTYVGWNVAASGFEKGRYCGNIGGYIPFAATRAERLAKGDPRPSLEERYPSHAAYVAKVKAQADALVAARYMLPDDAARIVAEAQAATVP
jgi:Alpha/beta hydrolase domain